MMPTNKTYEVDVIPTSAGDLEITFLGHGTLMLRLDDKVYHIDPFSNVADYAQLPKADVVLITHEHFDHLDMKALANIRKEGTVVIMSASCAPKVEGGMVMGNGDLHILEGLKVKAVPAYNIVHTRDNGDPFHPKGVGNGYVLTFGETSVYIAGDTENTPEMKQLQGIDVAFLPMNVPYTMTPEMVADAARAFHPTILYPYHFGETDTSQLVEQLKDEADIEVRVRSMA
jgi:L-ascorbate metabolism protein UlaG (beta-lactamase superfamily)